MNPRRGLKQGHWASYWQYWGAKKKRFWKRPKVGDAISYGMWPESTHVGIVVGVKTNRRGKVIKVRTVEANVGDKVTDMGWRKPSRLYGRGYKVRGYVSPSKY